MTKKVKNILEQVEFQYRNDIDMYNMGFYSLRDTERHMMDVYQGAIEMVVQMIRFNLLTETDQKTDIIDEIYKMKLEFDSKLDKIATEKALAELEKEAETESVDVHDDEKVLRDGIRSLFDELYRGKPEEAYGYAYEYISEAYTGGAISYEEHEALSDYIDGCYEFRKEYTATC